jgi:hypothetical protein
MYKNHFLTFEWIKILKIHNSALHIPQKFLSLAQIVDQIFTIEKWNLKDYTFMVTIPVFWPAESKNDDEKFWKLHPHA